MLRAGCQATTAANSLGPPLRGEQGDGAALGLAEQDEALGVDGGPWPLPRGRPGPGRVDDGVEIGDLGQEGHTGHVPARPAAAEGEAEGCQAHLVEMVGDVVGGGQGGGDAVAADGQGHPPVCVARGRIRGRAGGKAEDSVQRLPRVQDLEPVAACARCHVLSVTHARRQGAAGAPAWRPRCRAGPTRGSLRRRRG